MSLEIVLTCDDRECDKRLGQGMFSGLRLTKMTVLRWQGPLPGWYVDGSKVLCPDHAPRPLPAPQLETWTEYDRRGVEDDQDHEAYVARERKRLGV